MRAIEDRAARTRPNIGMTALTRVNEGQASADDRQLVMALWDGMRQAPPPERFDLIQFYNLSDAVDAWPLNSDLAMAPESPSEISCQPRPIRSSSSPRFALRSGVSLVICRQFRHRR